MTLGPGWLLHAAMANAPITHNDNRCHSVESGGSANRLLHHTKRRVPHVNHMSSISAPSLPYQNNLRNSEHLYDHRCIAHGATSTMQHQRLSAPVLVYDVLGPGARDSSGPAPHHFTPSAQHIQTTRTTRCTTHMTRRDTKTFEETTRHKKQTHMKTQEDTSTEIDTEGERERETRNIIHTTLGTRQDTPTHALLVFLRTMHTRALVLRLLGCTMPPQGPSTDA